MALRDRFFTPQTAKAIMSWRILLGIGAAAATIVAGLAWPLGVLVGAGAYVGSVAAAMPDGPERVRIDPFALSEPWRQIMQQAQGAGRKLRQTVDAADGGPLKTTLVDISQRLETGLGEAWAIARRGDEIDDAIRRLDPTALRSRLASARRRAEADRSPEVANEVASIERQLESADRLRLQSEQAAATLRLTQTQLDELVARASEVLVGAADTESYRREVDDLVIRLEALHQAVAETRPA